eukprot:TRINITY_DN70976_c1_g1_i1.p1 TRINITY_DN70976_c1_g1~~TRINITY_DN70976_c1_g1_i1.p1  ORF type:complete len:636 (+),score=144.29 TRINITY_DN70976_c1_g1_i1:273-2180(+)
MSATLWHLPRGPFVLAICKSLTKTSTSIWKLSSIFLFIRKLLTSLQSRVTTISYTWFDLQVHSLKRKQCEKILAIAGNCKTNKDSFIDVILGLEEHIQATLMEIMLKFIAKEEPSPHFSSPTVEGELVESLNAQLKQKEVERISMLEHVKKVEQENAEMAKKMAEIQNAYKEVTAEKLQEKSEFEEYKNRHYSGDSTPKIMQREAELEEEIDNLYNELSATKKAIGNMEKEKNEEIERLKDELTYAKTNAKKSAAMESLVGQLKKKIDELTLDKQSMAEELKNMESLQLRINSLEKDKKHVEDKNKKLIEDLYTEKNESRRVELEFKKLKAEYAKIEKELKYLEEKCKFSENQAKISEEALANFKKESESTRNSGDAGSLFALEKEASYKEEIEKLRADLQQLQADVGEAPKTRIVELEAMLKNLTEEKAKLEENLAAVNKRADEAERQSEDLKAQVDVLKKGNEATAEYVKEYQRVKKDRDTLLDVAKRAQDTLTELDALKNTTAELRNENETLKQSMESLKNEKATFEAELKKVKEMNGRFEKKLARDEEKIIFLQEERKRLETALQGTQKEVETELAKRLEEELAKQRQLLKQKYKAKTKSITVLILISIFYRKYQKRRKHRQSKKKRKINN